MQDSHTFMEQFEKDILDLKNQGKDVAFINAYRNPDKNWVGEVLVDGKKKQYANLGYGYTFRTM